MTSRVFDVESPHGRRATARANRVVIGVVLERLTWSVLDKEVLIGWEGTYGDPALARLTYHQADVESSRVTHSLLDAGVKHSDRILLYCDNSVEAVITMLYETRSR